MPKYNSTHEFNNFSTGTANAIQNPTRTTCKIYPRWMSGASIINVKHISNFILL